MNYFLTIKNFQIFANPHTYGDRVIEIVNCTNIVFQNGTFVCLQPDQPLDYSQGLFARNSSLVFSDVCFYDGYCLYLYQVNDSVFEKLIYINPMNTHDLIYNDYPFLAYSSNNITFRDNYYNDVVITSEWHEWDYYRGIRFGDCTNISIYNNSLKNHGFYITDTIDLRIEDNISNSSHGLFIRSCDNILVRNNTFHFLNDYFNVVYTNNMLVEDNLVLYPWSCTF